MLRRTFKDNLAAQAQVTASNVRGGAKTFDPRNLVDGDRFSYWATSDDVTTAEAVFDLKRAVTFNVIRLRENLRLGQRVDEFAVDAWKDGAWQTIAQATSIGSCRLLKTSAPVTSTKVRLRITKAAASPALSEFGLFTEAV
jgi:alpha-L-fucosidase